MSASTAPGPTPSSGLEANQEALELAQQMLEQREVHRTIIEETIASARQGNLRESGRTVCGAAHNLKEPIARRYTTVSLPTCPRSVGGSWHTHVTNSELLNPQHSLPDMANVAFEIMDVSIVAGAESSEVLVAADDRDAMRATFMQELGIEAAGPADVVDALLEGEVDNPPAARERLRESLGSTLVKRVDTAHPDLAEEVRTLEMPTDPWAEQDDEMVTACPMYAVYRTEQPRPVAPVAIDFERFRGQAERNAEAFRDAWAAVGPPDNVSLREEAWGTLIGSAASMAFQNLLVP